MKKTFKFIMTFFVLLLLLVGCTKKPDTTADTSAKIFYNIIIKKDSSQKAKVNFDNKDIEKISSNFENSLSSSIKSSIIKIDNINAEDTKVLVNSFRDALKKTTVNTKILKEDKENATIEYSIKGLNLDSIVSDLNKEVLSYFEENPDLKNDSKEIVKIYLETFNKILSNPPINSSPTKLTMDFKLLDGFWEPKNPSDFGKIISASMSIN